MLIPTQEKYSTPHQKNNPLPLCLNGALPQAPGFFRTKKDRGEEKDEAFILINKLIIKQIKI